MKASFPICSDISMEGMSSDHTEAAIITPDANPRSIFCTRGLISFFRKNTQAAPSVVPAKGIKIPRNVFIFYHLLFFYS